MMSIFSRRLSFFILLISPLLLSSCASVSPQIPESELKAYKVIEEKSFPGHYAPTFIIEDPENKFNQIGTPWARTVSDGKEEVFVDYEKSTIYYETREFQTTKASYTNLIYRIHFEQVPFSLVPFYIGMGKNVGLMVVVTLNSRNEPVLYTTVHTCGCYIAFMPTSFMPEDAFPESWRKERQTIFGESLPGLLDYNGFPLIDARLMVLIKSGSHRVKDAWLAGKDSLHQYDAVVMDIQPMASLERLPLPDGTTSFYEASGSREGYVKGSHKFWERLLMSWWTFDWRIGEDKKLGENLDDGPVFYTSIKAWQRQASDLRDFPGFLNYWGWGL